PFNPNTNIKFYIKEKSKVVLLVYNLQGQLIETLIDKELETGFHSFNFDGSRLPSGIYFYELKANNFREIKKMILLK
ncbi:MAG: T9SS type A sorting domain-containing protein, partial [Ignavibacteria bacterium]